MLDDQLIEAVKAGQDDNVLALIAKGADVNCSSQEQAWTPLCFAAGRGSLNAIRMLLEHGADVFKTGVDRRTPYKIALAAGHAESAKLLASAEARAGEDHDGKSSEQGRRRLYCKAYLASALRPFLEGASEDDIVYVHQDFSVTRSIWHGKDVCIDGRSPEWQRYCRETLSFRVPDDYDLIPALSADRREGAEP